MIVDREAATIASHGIAHSSQIRKGPDRRRRPLSWLVDDVAPDRGIPTSIDGTPIVLNPARAGKSADLRRPAGAGAAALRNGCLIVAAAGNDGSTTGSPANSPTIMSVASLDMKLSPSSFSNFGKVEIAAPGRDVFSSWPRPLRYRTISGTSMATPHVAGCAALWAQSNASLRGMTLWRKLQSSARHLPLAAARVGSGLVQAP